MKDMSLDGSKRVAADQVSGTGVGPRPRNAETTEDTKSTKRTKRSYRNHERPTEKTYEEDLGS
jgi:hypothetical protein